MSIEGKALLLVVQVGWAIAFYVLGLTRKRDKAWDAGWHQGMADHRSIITKVYAPDDRSIDVALRRYVELQAKADGLRRLETTERQSSSGQETDK